MNSLLSFFVHMSLLCVWKYFFMYVWDSKPYAQRHTGEDLLYWRMEWKGWYDLGMIEKEIGD